MPELSRYSHRVVLRNGNSLLLRAIRPDDKQALLDGFHRLTGKSIYFRFLGAKHELTAQELKYFTEVDFVHHVALVATLTSTGEEQPIGVGRYIELNEQSPGRVAEVAFAVDDAYQNLVVGTLLFEHIVSIAQYSGISRLQADVLLANKHMLEIFRNSGFELETTTNNALLHIEFQIASRQSN